MGTRTSGAEQRAPLARNRADLRATRRSKGEASQWFLAFAGAVLVLVLLAGAAGLWPIWREPGPASGGGGDAAAESSRTLGRTTEPRRPVPAGTDDATFSAPFYSRPRHVAAPHEFVVRLRRRPDEPATRVLVGDDEIGTIGGRGTDVLVTVETTAHAWRLRLAQESATDVRATAVVESVAAVPTSEVVAVVDALVRAGFANVNFTGTRPDPARDAPHIERK